MVGIPKFKPEPEDEHVRATAVNFAAPYKRSERKSVKTAEAPLGQNSDYHHEISGTSRRFQEIGTKFLPLSHEHVSVSVR